ncbi:MAG: molybdopterin molybdenumtransferase MoeA, partial [Verrucomicrobiota bacterium]
MSTPSLTSLADALAVIRAQTKPLAVIKLPLSAALHSVLAEPVTTPDDIPAFARSAMDGYAVHENPDTNQLTYSIQGEVHTAESWETALDSGTCVRIATGAAVPDGTSRVIPKELAKESTDR